MMQGTPGQNGIDGMDGLDGIPGPRGSTGKRVSMHETLSPYLAVVIIISLLGRSWT